MPYPLVRLVASPDIDAEIRCDLNEDTTWPDANAFSLGAPPLLGDPGGVGADYGYRTLVFNLAICDGEARALAKQSEVARQLLRNENYLLFQLSETASPVWFRCVRSTPGEMSLAQVYLDYDTNTWLIAVSLVADPFAVGELTTAVPDGSATVTIKNDPALVNGLSVRLTNIVGDAPAPLNVALTAGTDGFVQPLISVMPLDAPWTGATFAQAESFTPTSVIVATAADATASGGSRMSVNLGSNGQVVVDRLTSTTFQVPYAGRYRLFARARAVTTAGSIPTGTMIAGSGASLVRGVSTDLGDRGGQLWRMVELGMYAFPKGNMPGRRPYTLGPGAVAVGAGAPSPVRVDVDYIVAIPVDLPLDQMAPPALLEFTDPETTLGSDTLLLNAEDETVEQISGGQHLAAAPEVPHGSFLSVTPGVDNGLTFLPRRFRSATKFDDRLGESNTLTLTYRPRWLYLAGS